MGLGILKRTREPAEPLAFLDIGSSKIACLIAEPVPGEPPRAGAPLPLRRLGFGLTKSEGIRAGAVTDLNLAEGAVRQAVAEAESEAGLSIRDAAVAVGGARVSSLTFSLGMATKTGTVSGADIERVLERGRAHAAEGGREVLHMHRLAYKLDGESGVRNPRGMPGEKLGLTLNAVRADGGLMRNTKALLARAYLKPAAFVAAPYAAALAVLSEDDLTGGTTVVDFGAETTGFALFHNGLFIGSGAVPLGGQQITEDIARSLLLPVSDAERIKTLYGNLLGAMSDEHEVLPIVPEGEAGDLGDQRRITRAKLRRVLVPRVDETLAALRSAISATGLAKRASGRLVLTGGACELAGLADRAARALGGDGVDVRVARPMPIEGFAPGEMAPMLAGVFGLAYARMVPGAIPGEVAAGAPAPKTYAGRLSRWFKDSFWDEETAGSGAA